MPYLTLIYLPPGDDTSEESDETGGFGNDGDGALARKSKNYIIVQNLMA